MKTLKQIREEYDANFLPYNEVMLEGTATGFGDPYPKSKRLGDHKTKAFDVPSPVQMPNLLMFRRITYRRYPDQQTVALYYSKAVDKYLPIPFGPTGNLNLGEATIYDTLEELDLHEGAKWEAVKGGLKGAAHGAIRGLVKGNAVAAEPGMAIGAVVGGVRGAYKGAKNAYNKSKEEGIDEDWQSVNRKDKTDGLSQAAVNAYRRENPGSKLKTAVTEKNPSGKRAARRKSFCSRMGGMKKRLTSAKTARDPDSRINKALRRWNCEESFKAKLNEKRGERLDEFWGSVAKAVGGWALNKLLGSSDGDSKSSSSNSSSGSGENDAVRKINPDTSKKAQVKTYAPNARSSDSAIDKARHTAVMRKEYENTKKKEASGVAENKISDLRKMVNESIKSIDLPINGRTVTLNNSMAKRILEVYDSVNTKNKKVVESMLNEDLESFKKLLNFSIRK